jgi:hypothetical protein
VADPAAGSGVAAARDRYEKAGLMDPDTGDRLGARDIGSY